jgi:hypothetical protein
MPRGRSNNRQSRQPDPPFEPIDPAKSKGRCDLIRRPIGEGVLCVLLRVSVLSHRVSRRGPRRLECRPGHMGTDAVRGGYPDRFALLRPNRCRVARVVTNDREASFAGTRHLVELGHRSFFYIGNMAGSCHEVERFVGFRDCLRQVGISPRSSRRYEGDFRFESGRAAAAHYVALKHVRQPSSVPLTTWPSAS